MFDFYGYAFDIYSHFICLINQCLNTRTNFIINNLFTKNHVIVVNKVSTNSNVDSKKY